MFSHLDPVLLSRLQFAFTISFHILFPAFTIGLASWLAVVEACWLKTKHPVYKEIYLFWVRIFAVTFGMGVVSGVVMSYEFGTNWSQFSLKIGSVLGPLMGFEVLTAFFLEASFLGIMLFGWNKVGPRMHFAATLIVAVGTLISAFWILSANSWMHTPQGFATDPATGNLIPTSWLKIIFNPSFPYRFAHMVNGAYLTTAFVVGGVASFYLYHGKHLPHARIMLAMAMLMAVTAAPLQLLIGDAHGLNTLKHQPAKIAAMEGLYKTEKSIPLLLFGWPDAAGESMTHQLAIPGLSSLILTHSWQGEVKGLADFPKQDCPPLLPVFFAFRVMVGIGMAMILTGLLAAILFFRRRLFASRPFQLWCMALTPAGFIAILSGWFTTEIGRQPWLVYGVLRTKDMVSPVSGHTVALSLAAFVIIYLLVFGAATYYLIRLIAKGPNGGDWLTTHDPGTAHGLRLRDAFLRSV